jgi:hypothetical protein
MQLYNNDYFSFLFFFVVSYPFTDGDGVYVIRSQVT